MCGEPFFWDFPPGAASSPWRLGQAALLCQEGGSSGCSQRAGQRREDGALALRLQGGPSLRCWEEGLCEC